MLVSERTAINKKVFIEAAKPKILRKGKQILKQIFKKYFLPAFEEGNYPCEPISLKTFYKYVERYIHPYELIAAQEGRVALKHKTNAKTSKHMSEGFGVRTEADCYHEPIALLDPRNFKPTGNRPIHYLAQEIHLGVYVGWISDYDFGSERSSHVIELYKNMMFPKVDFQEKFGSKHPNKIYCKPSVIANDGSSAFTAAAPEEFIELSNTMNELGRTQTPQGKPFVESGNFSIKRNFTFSLPGHYNDNQKEYIDTKHFSKLAVLTTLEHYILFNRYINDTHNHGYDKRRDISRAEQWDSEAAFKEIALPDNYEALMDFHGLKDNKTIQVGVGIQFHVHGKTYTYNSDQLQELRSKMVHNKLGSRVDFHHSEFFPKEIKVVNVISDEPLYVPIVEEDEDSIIPFVGDEFYVELAKLQTIERLSKMSNKKIIAEAEKRDRAIKRYELKKKREKAEDAKHVQAVLDEDTAKIKLAMDKTHFSEGDEEQKGGREKSEVSSPKVDDTKKQEDRPNDEPENDQDEDWEDNVEF